jgi:hypothetical protein
MRLGRPTPLLHQLLLLLLPLLPLLLSQERLLENPTHVLPSR